MAIALIMTMRVPVVFLFILTITSLQFQHFRSEQFPSSRRSEAEEDNKTSIAYSETANRASIISASSLGSDDGRRALAGFRAGGTTAAGVARRSSSGCGPAAAASTLLVSLVVTCFVVAVAVNL